ncbi:predicted protein [Nematostella vectensis]|uniref:Uncharacterized protein n=1 Tax=Nematostella vectensis TaxID=45351 RepID=A7S0T8_NEMVE|nr:predicted protein [Nematostella vectensis]|eukprot:XP_001634664.1 predicted protein [Nematostella vectensis]
MIIRMGGFHIALNFIAAIGKMFQDSSIEDLLIESGVFGCSTASSLLKGKSYNRGVRAHKLLLEALLRLQWRAFGEWISVEKHAGAIDEDKLVTIIQACRQSSSGGDLKVAFYRLCERLPALTDLFSEFRRQVSQQSNLFRFWDLYIDAVMLLLCFIRAEREGSWNLHLNAVAEMAPFFFCMDRINYSRWIPVYLADMFFLQETAPEVHTEFVEGNHPVARSSAPSANHERAAITAATRKVCDLDNPTTSHSNKESGKTRVQRDESDVQKLLSVIDDTIADPFYLKEASPQDLTPLRNIATGVVMPQPQADRLLKCVDIGAEELQKFTNERLNNSTVSFWGKMSKVNVKTFASLSKATKIKRGNYVYRSQLVQLLIAANTREIDLRVVLSYELKTTKSALLVEMEEVCPAEERLPQGEEPSVFIHDGMAVIQMLKSEGSRTFESLAETLFKFVSSPLRQDGFTKVDIVFDRYDLPKSIKEVERLRRGSSSALEVKIASHNTPIPKQWSKFIGNKKNKISFLKFLCKEWSEMGQR